MIFFGLTLLRKVVLGLSLQARSQLFERFSLGLEAAGGVGGARPVGLHHFVDDVVRDVAVVGRARRWADGLGRGQSCCFCLSSNGQFGGIL